MFDRTFMSGEVRCGNGCGYCFSHWENPTGFSPFFSPLKSGEWEIVYPVCDSEANIQNLKFWENIEIFLRGNPKGILSLSTKNMWSDDMLDKIRRLGEELGHERIKLSVSFSCKAQISEIEPHALSYDLRIELLRKLAERGILHSVMMKPLLPFVTLKEYKEIVDDTCPFCTDYVSGDLYVDRSTLFYNRYIKDKFDIGIRYCCWMKKEVCYVKHPHEEDIVQYIRSRRLCWYASDAEFLEKQIRRSLYAE
jgi:DNA repair photolyase